MASLFIGSCTCLGHVSKPRSKSRVRSSPNYKNVQSNRSGGVVLTDLGQEHEYIMNTIIEPLLSKNFEENNGKMLIERVLKVHNTKEKCSRFEEQVQAQEDSLTQHSSLANVDVIWRFRGEALAEKCSLGSERSDMRLRLCDDESGECGLCSCLGQEKKGNCTMTSSMALKSFGDVGDRRKAVILCKVVPRRIDELSWFNQLNAKASVLYVQNKSALLPEFVVIYKSKSNSENRV